MEGSPWAGEGGSAGESRAERVRGHGTECACGDDASEAEQYGLESKVGSIPHDWCVVRVLSPRRLTGRAKIRKRTLVWTIEWIHNNGRSELGSCLASCALEDAYASQISPRPAKRKRDSSSPSPSSSAPPNPVLPPSPRPSRPDPRPSPSPAKAPLYFYLLRPGTPTGTRVLIPLEPTATLSTALRHRVVLEFPTLYALRYPPANLPTAFITEALYDRQGQRSEALLGTAEAGREAWDGGTGGGESATAEAGNGDVDERKLAEVLARDLGA